MSGHSKWNNIKGRKGAADSKKSKVFGQVAKQIRIAVKEGGSSDPNSNISLRAALEKARAANMPKDKIQKAIDRGAGKTAGGAQVVEILYEGFGQFGEAYLVQVASDNPHRTGSEIRNVFTHGGGSLAGPHAAQHLFTRQPDQSYVPIVPLEVAPGQMQVIAAFIDQLHEQEEVEEVFVSVVLPEESDS